MSIETTIDVYSEVGIVIAVNYFDTYNKFDML